MPRTGGQKKGRGGAPQFPAPDEDAFKAKVAVIDARILKLRDDLLAVQKKQKQHSSFLRKAKENSRERQTAMRPLVAELKKLRRQRGDYLSNMAAKSREIDAVKAKRDATATAASSGASGSGSSAGPQKSRSRKWIQERMRDLEQRQQTENMTLSEEKGLVKELAALRVALLATANLDTLYSEKKEIFAKIRNVEAMLKEQQILLDEARAATTINNEEAAKGNNAGTPTSMNDLQSQIKAIQNQRPLLEMAYQKIRADVDAAHAEKKALYDQHWDAKREHKRLLDEWYEEQRAQARREDARLREQEAKQREEEEEELMKQKPWLQEMALCDLLTAFCQRYVRGSSSPQKSSSEENNNVVVVVDSKNEPAVYGGGGAPKSNVLVDTEGLGEMISRKSDSNRYTEKGKRCKTKGRQSSSRKKKVMQKKAARIVNTPDTLAGFSQLGIAHPRTTHDIPATISALRTKRDYFDTLPRNPVPSKEDPPLAD